MVDGWRGDDWFHNGAFRLDSLTYIHDQEATRGSDVTWWSDHYDDYETWMSVGAAGEMAQRHGLEQVGFAGKVMSHPAYDAFWQDQAVDKILAAQGISVPTMLVHSLWDQEDIYGNIAVYKALKAQQPEDPNLYLVIGPWFHHQERLDGSAVGQIRFGSDTAAYFRRQVLRPFLDHYLKDDAPPLALTPVTAFETGTNRWLSPRRLAQRLRGRGAASIVGICSCSRAAGCSWRPPVRNAPPKPLHPVSSPMFRIRQNRCPYMPRPIHIGGPDGETNWQTWLVGDQRDGRVAHRRSQFLHAAAGGTREDQRRTDRKSRRIEHGHRRGFRGEADRRLSAGGRTRTQDGRLSTDESQRIFYAAATAIP